MKERPILFSAPMVRAILEGRKTQTRRVVKPQPVVSNENGGWFVRNKGKGHKVYLYSWPMGGAAHEQWVVEQCPYGVPGDRLYVRETWQYGPDVTAGMMAAGKMSRRHVVYAATVKDGQHPPSWRPSIHMPRWASRITLEVVSVRVERLQEISDGDARAEGVPTPKAHEWTISDKDLYARLWESINGSGSWAANPWVWVVEFKRLEAQ